MHATSKWSRLRLCTLARAIVSNRIKQQWIFFPGFLLVLYSLPSYLNMHDLSVETVGLCNIDCLQPFIFSWFYSIVECADRIARELDASVKRETRRDMRNSFL